PVLYGEEEFIRRVSCEGAVSGNYDEGIAEETPCYSGWLFARIKADGNVTPCLKSHRLSTGNINDSSFGEIWNSLPQQYFREKTRTLRKTEPYFFMIGNGSPGSPGCSRICDDLTRNIAMHRKIALFPLGRLMIKIACLENGLKKLNKRVARSAKIIYLITVVLTYSLLLKFIRSIKKMYIFPGE
ncbi:hypothetical protein EPN54_00635, partial [bacterium]